MPIMPSRTVVVLLTQAVVYHTNIVETQCRPCQCACRQSSANRSSYTIQCLTAPGQFNELVFLSMLSPNDIYKRCAPQLPTFIDAATDSKPPRPWLTERFGITLSEQQKLKSLPDRTSIWHTNSDLHLAHISIRNPCHKLVRQVFQLATSSSSFRHPWPQACAGLFRRRLVTRRCPSFVAITDGSFPTHAFFPLGFGRRGL